MSEMIEFTREEFESLNEMSGGLARLEYTLSGVANDEIMSEIEQLREQLALALRRRRLIEAEEFDRKMAAWDLDNGNPPHPVRAIWSAYDLGEPTTATPWPNARRVRYCSEWDGFDVTQDIEGSTLLDLFRASELAIQKSGDAHHVFVEGFESHEDELILITGS